VRTTTTATSDRCDDTTAMTATRVTCAPASADHVPRVPDEIVDRNVPHLETVADRRHDVMNRQPALERAVTVAPQATDPVRREATTLATPARRAEPDPTIETRAVVARAFPRAVVAPALEPRTVTSDLAERPARERTVDRES
jgi:hypothetical protein